MSPYIKLGDRPELDAIIMQFPQMEEPELDYVITRLAIRFAKEHDFRFVTLNKVWGVMTGAAAEFYRRLIGPYENRKVKENGDVYQDVLSLYGIEPSDED